MQRRLTDVELKDVSKAEAEIRQLAVDGLIHLQDPLLQTLTRMLINGTTDGRPYVEPPLTDEDARQRPWVMVRDSDGEPWKGPHRFAAKCVDEYYPYYVFSEDKTSAVEFNCCRRATAEEIAAAGLEVAE
jgi:hypothetical protein